VKKRIWRPTREVAIAATAVGAIAIALSHPAVQSLAGLDIAHQRRAPHEIDPLAIGTIQQQKNVHGLAGILRPMRMRD